jgi:hypothetical protein
LKLYRHHFKVKGVTSFPIDMLRYDSCRPAHEPDSHAIIRTFDGEIEAVTVEVCSMNRNLHWSPTVDRWKSFGWKVLLESFERVPVEL